MSKNSEDLSDDFVASILSKEASEKNIKYSALGLQAFLPKRSATNAPKPNTRFLRNIVREADSHNAALLAKEAEESKERLRILHLKERAKRRGETVGSNGVEGGNEKSRAAQRPDRQIYRVGAKRGVPVTKNAQNESRGEKGNERKRRRSQSRDGKEGERSKSHRSRSTDQRSRSPDVEREERRYRRESRSRERRRSREHRRDRSREHKRSRSDDQKKSDSNKYHRHYSSRHHSSKDIDGSRHSYRSRSRERGIDKSSTSHRPDRKDRSDTNAKSRSSRPRSPRRRPDESDADRERRRKRRKEMEMVEEPDRSSRASTDPLLAIIGPAPPPPTRTRGRGTMSGSSAMDARFSEQYDPAMDVRPDPDDEDDDWDNAIEAYRDRQKWKALGAERLRSAGFDEDFITAWENNDTKNTANIKWAKEGVREWDRGKVMVEGEVKVKASWAKD